MPFGAASEIDPAISVPERVLYCSLDRQVNRADPRVSLVEPVAEEQRLSAGYQSEHYGDSILRSLEREDPHLVRGNENACGLFDHLKRSLVERRAATVFPSRKVEAPVFQERFLVGFFRSGQRCSGADFVGSPLRNAELLAEITTTARKPSFEAGAGCVDNRSGVGRGGISPGLEMPRPGPEVSSIPSSAIRSGAGVAFASAAAISRVTSGSMPGLASGLIRRVMSPPSRR
jgi:hypothetical protein